MEGGNSNNNNNNNNFTMMNTPKVTTSTGPTSQSSGTNTNQQVGNASSILNKSGGRPPRPPSSPRTQYREQDCYMPIANVIRVMRRMLPSHAKIADEAKETIQESVSEFISFVTEEANERCHNEQRKTITADDLIWAMARLGFDNYVEPLSLYLQRYREMEGGDHHRAPRMKFVRPSIVSPTMMVRPSLVSPNPNGGLGFGINYGSTRSSATPIATTTTITTTTPEKNIGCDDGSGEHVFSSINSINFGVGNRSNNDMLGFDDTFELSPTVVTPPSTSTSNNTPKEGDQELEFFDQFVQFK